MDLPGEAFLFNFSLLSITFSTVSAVVMLLRQTMGGKLSDFDIFLLNAYVAHGFVLAIAAILPSLIAQFGFQESSVWVIASLAAAVAMGTKTGNTMRQRRAITKTRMPVTMTISFAAQWSAILLMVLNALLPSIRSIAVFDLALTISLCTIMWAFVRRILSLMGEHAHEDWDPTRG